jgi:putative transposase
LFGPDVAPMSLELFVDKFAGWVIDYNTTRLHSALSGQTPLQRWNADATPIREVPEAELRWLLLADVERTVNKDGVHFGGVTFIAAELNGLVGERVQIRYTPHDLRRTEVFRADEWLATALPQDLLGPEERAAVLARRRSDAAELGRRQRRASRRARATLAPITEPGPTQDTTTVTAEAAHAVRRGDRDQRDRDLRRLARTDLLDLKRDFAYWNPPAEAAAQAVQDVSSPASGAGD